MGESHEAAPQRRPLEMTQDDIAERCDRARKVVFDSIPADMLDKVRARMAGDSPKPRRRWRWTR